MAVNNFKIKILSRAKLEIEEDPNITRIKL
jgi:hypothetical protein